MRPEKNLVTIEDKKEKLLVTLRNSHQLRVAFVVQQKILGLQIAVDDSPRVQVSKSFYDATGVESCRPVIKESPARKQDEEMRRRLNLNRKF